MRNLYPQYIKNFCNSIIKRHPNLKIGKGFLYWFPIPAITHHYKLRDLKLHKCITLLFLMSEIQNQTH